MGVNGGGQSGGQSGGRGIPPAPDPLPVDVVDNHLHLDIARHGDCLLYTSDAADE